ncbi:MAG TPA: UDP-3-O-(3-hydroxymyristoyl)glucosamine N-acyltransferase [Gemmatimonadales bacterium]|nr:UDP-3-O-(3-hydroxymyristoyl)glucosamine N-acyltransferase [Gemmatimonadales bacterium]
MARPGRHTARAVAELVGGQLQGDGDLILQDLAPLHRAGPDALTFLAAPQYLAAFRATRAGAALVTPLHAAEPEGPRTRIVVTDLAEALSRVAELFVPSPTRPKGTDPAARIGAQAEIGPDSFIGPCAIIGERARLGARVVVEAGAWIGHGVVVGDDCHIGPNAVCYPGARLGRRVTLKAGAVVGGAGFGYLKSRDGHRRLPHLGGCVLEDDVEIGSATCIDRGTFDDTVIGPGTKIDNLVQIGHNVRMGARCLVMATTGIAGSVQIGDDVVIAGGVGIADRAVVGDGAVLSAKSVIFGPGAIAAGALVGGYPARPHREFLRAQAALYTLAPLAEDITVMVAEHQRGAQAQRKPRG